MPASLAPALRADFEPRPSVPVRPQLALVPASAAEVAATQAAAAAAELPVASYTPAHAQLAALLPGLRRRALRWCRDAALADDLVQETLLRAWRHTGSFENEAHLRAWSHTVLHNLLVSRGRREQSARRALALLGATSAESVSGWRPPAPGFLLPSLERALDSLPEPFAGTLRLVDLEDHSYAEAAAVLGVPVGTIMSRLFRGRRRLAKALVETSESAPRARDCASV
jgi:RNA polymerase sigma-70 factor, ECF subfamily